MVNSATYSDLVMGWQPVDSRDNQFVVIVVAVVLLLFSLAFFLSSIDLPQEDRRIITPVPERIAEYIDSRPKPPPPPPEPPPEPKPEPPKPKPTVERDLPKVEEPLTEVQKEARKTAEESGLLALGNELADLFDTSDVSAMVGGTVNDTSPSATQASDFNRDALTSGASQGSGGVDASEYAATISGSSQLSERERVAVRQSLLTEEQIAAEEEKASDSRPRTGTNIRAEEEVTIIFDQNKGRLFSVYNRARRTNPGLQGKVVFELTIAPNGSVTEAKILSSELNAPDFEKRLLARIRQFKFGEKEVEEVTVTFPIEFLPS